MTTFTFKALRSAIDELENPGSDVDFTKKSLKLDSAKDAQPIVNAINLCKNLQYLILTGNTLGVDAAKAIAEALANKHELIEARFSDMFTGQMETEIPPALSALCDGMIKASARLRVLDLSDNALGPIGVQSLTKLLQSNVCAELQELHLNNNGLGITGGKLLASALKNMKLKLFAAGQNRLEDDGAAALAKVFKVMGTLEELSMPQNGIYPVGLSALADALENNPLLRTLNLNDNAIGKKGAKSIAKALPRLKKLRSINFGDCLLKSKGALVLATAFRLNSQSIKSIDMSYNEIDHVACLNLAQALTALPDSGKRLERVVLEGNYIEAPNCRNKLKRILGDCAVMSNGEENDIDSGDERYSKEFIAKERREVQAAYAALQQIKGVQLFLKEPSYKNLIRLGESPVIAIDTYLEALIDPQEFVLKYVELLMLVSGLVSASSVSTVLYSRMALRISSRPAAVQWTLADAMLRSLKLIKTENPFPIRWHLPACYKILASHIADETFPSALRATIRLFINNKKSSLPDNIQAIIEAHPILLRDI